MILQNIVANLFVEGGSLFMTLILICLLGAIGLLIRGFIHLKKNAQVATKMTRLASDVSLLGLVIGFLGSILGMIGAFDAIEGAGAISSGMLAAGLKVSFITTLFGSITFIIPRIGIVIIRSLQSAEHSQVETVTE